MNRILLFLCLNFVLQPCCQTQTSIIISQVKVESEEATSQEGIDFFEITYWSDGLKIEAFAAIPKKEGKYPAIIFNRGGNRSFGALSLYGGNRTYPAVYGFGPLAQAGYVVIGCNYRGGGKSEGEDEFGGKDINDVLNLIEAIKELPKADASKIGMYGWSRGGMMTYLALTKTNQIKAAAVGGATADITEIDRPNMETNVYAELIPNYWENKEAELKKRSAVFWADKFPKDVPLLIMHGNSDWRVKSTHSLKLAIELDKHRIPYRLKIFEGADHGIKQYRSEVNEDVIFWFNRFLKRGEKLPNMEFHGN